MSALNCFVQKDAVHIITDGAVYDANGTLLCAAPKSYALPHLRAAVGIRGPKVAVPGIIDLLGSFAEDFAGLRKYAPELLANIGKLTQNRSAYGNDADLVVAGIDDDDKPAAFLVVNHDKAGIPRNTPVPITGVLITPGTLPILRALKPRARGLDDIVADQLDPEADGRRLLEAQRQHVEPVGAYKAPVAFAGAFGQLTTVTAEGVTTKIIQRWPDVRGARFGAAASAAERPPQGLTALHLAGAYRRAEQHA